MNSVVPSFPFKLDILARAVKACFVTNTQLCFSSIIWFYICSKYFVQIFPPRLQFSVSTICNLWKTFLKLLQRFRFQRLTLKSIVKRSVMERFIFLIRARYVNLARIVCYFCPEKMKYL